MSCFVRFVISFWTVVRFSQVCKLFCQVCKLFCQVCKLFCQVCKLRVGFVSFFVRFVSFFCQVCQLFCQVSHCLATCPKIFQSLLVCKEPMLLCMSHVLQVARSMLPPQTQIHTRTQDFPNPHPNSYETRTTPLPSCTGLIYQAPNSHPDPRSQLGQAHRIKGRTNSTALAAYALQTSKGYKRLGPGRGDGCCLLFARVMILDGFF